MLNGVINVYKEKGYTSHDVVAKMRGIFRQKKIGHTGTLDPDAVGVLPVCLGNATKLCDLLTDRSKEYRAVLRLGIATDTQDMSGTVLSEQEVTCGPEEVRDAILGFVGEYDQIPPMYSALKVNGQKLVDLARRGIEVERKPRRVGILSIVIEEISLPRVTMTVKCTKGTYIRTLCDDIGRKLCCGGCMEELTRTASGQFRIGDAVTLGALRESCDAGEPERYLIPVDQVLADHPAVSSVPEGDRFLHNGNPVAVEFIHPETEEICRVYDSSGQFTGLYRKAGNYYRPEKMFL